MRSDDAELSAMPDKAVPATVIAAAVEAAVDLKQPEMTPTTAVAAAPDCVAIDHPVVVPAEER